MQRFYSGEHVGFYSKKDCLDANLLFEFFEKSQPKELAKLKQNRGADYQKEFLVRLQKEIKEKGILQVLRNDNSRINLSDDAEEIRRKIKKAVTTPEGIENLQRIYLACGEQKTARLNFENAVAAKERVAEAIIKELSK